MLGLKTKQNKKPKKKKKKKKASLRKYDNTFLY